MLRLKFFHLFRGKGDYYRLGHGSDDHVRRPKRVAALQNKKVVAIATGSLHCVACTDTGEVYTWGDNDEGQLGDGSTNAIQRPRLVTALQVIYSTLLRAPQPELTGISWLRSRFYPCKKARFRPFSRSRRGLLFRTTAGNRGSLATRMW